LVDHFLGILENVSEIIVNMPLKHGYSFDILSYHDLENILLAIEGDGWQYSCEYDHLYNYFDVKGRQDNYVIITQNQSQNGDHLDYILETFEKMRLFKPGNIRLIYYCCHDEIQEGDLDGSVASVSSTMSSEIIFTDDNSFYDIKVEEIPELLDFLNNFTLPLKHDYLQLAYETYQKTFEIKDKNLSFLVSMIGIELLLNPSHIEITHRVSRNAAVLIGKNKDESIEIYERMKKLYGIRSKIVHGELMRVDSEVHLKEIRSYLKESIQESTKLNISKQELMFELNTYGFTNY